MQQCRRKNNQGNDLIDSAKETKVKKQVVLTIVFSTNKSLKKEKRPLIRKNKKKLCQEQ